METLTIDPPTDLRRRGPRLLLGLAGVLVVVAVVGLVDPGSYVVLAPLAGYFFVLTTLALVALVAGLAWGARSRSWREVCVGVGAGVITLWLVVAWLSGDLLGGGEELATASAPGVDTHYWAVARDDPGAIFDPVTLVRIEQTTGPLAREWTVGCVSGDDDSDGLIGLSWQDATHLRVITSENVYRVTVDSRTGRPQQVPDSFGC